jgi:hypothetical protein
MPHILRQILYNLEYPFSAIINAMYQKLSTEFYDLEPHKDGKEAAAFYLARAREAQGPILEPMCGSGRFLLPLLQEGIDAEGFDSSPHMIQSLHAKYRAIGDGSPPAQQLKLEEFKSDRRYAMIFIPYGSLGLVLEPKAVKEGLKNLYNHLLPGGKLFLDIETVASVPACDIPQRGVNTREDGTCIVLNTLPTYDKEAQLFTCYCRYESLVQGRIEAVEYEEFKQYLYRFDELDCLLAEVGFSSVQKTRNYKGDPSSREQDPLIIYCCKK